MLTMMGKMLAATYHPAATKAFLQCLLFGIPIVFGSYLIYLLVFCTDWKEVFRRRK